MMRYASTPAVRRMPASGICDHFRRSQQHFQQPGRNTIDSRNEPGGPVLRTDTHGASGEQSRIGNWRWEDSAFHGQGRSGLYAL